ncbi:hypothetical protein PGH07_00270 [Sulfurovum sp. zt1-1]|uniref:Flagella basal body P-ring formation protein FlgA n=1 Tax=Sulfurovum zhangzhouensis TaxID=3019067 RepID=A0ABT7QWA9_9BACT|nr:hypothetical protein [Sulfurovum zhangzhouensis]MDM5270606.1 hypothetical protein [Sulfurovum zhangzhouensis]
MKKFLFNITLLFSAKLLAELPPYVYEELQKNAPELLLIKINSVETNVSLFTETRVNVVAEVLEVRRSKSGLKKNDRITIVYTTFTSRPRGWVGPSPVPLLEKDKTYSAFLRKSEEVNIYMPAAKGKSFQ